MESYSTFLSVSGFSGPAACRFIFISDPTRTVFLRLGKIPLNRSLGRRWPTEAVTTWPPGMTEIWWGKLVAGRLVVLSLPSAVGSICLCYICWVYKIYIWRSNFMHVTQNWQLNITFSHLRKIELNSHYVKRTLLESIAQCCFIYSQCCTITASV